MKLHASPTILYVRKSKEADDQQAASLDQQREAIFKRFGPIPEYFEDKSPRWFSDSQSGKTFERPGFQAMLAFCQANPQPEEAPGTIYMWDETRFGRALKPDGRADLRTMKRVAWQFEDAGWKIEFLNRTKTGNELFDDIMDTLSFNQASDYLVKLSANVRRGKRNWASEGYWIGGRPPFPAVRQEAYSGRILSKGTLGTEPVLLVPDPEKLKHWIHGAKMLVAGKSLSDVCRYYMDNVTPFKGGERWNTSTIKKIYTNEALTGRMTCEFADGSEIVDTRWEPVVPLDLYNQVQDELQRRTTDARGRSRPRAADSEFLLQNVYCAFCGARYVGAHAKGSKAPRYRHSGVNTMNLDPATLETAKREGCRNWTIDALQLDTAIKELIISQRSSKEAADAIRALFEQQSRFETSVQGELEEAEKRVRELQRQIENTMRAVSLADDADLQRELMATVKEKKATMATARRDVAMLMERSKAVGQQWDDIAEVLEETRLIAENWETMSFAERQRIVEWWVSDVAITVKHTAGEFHARSRGAIVHLNIDPFEPYSVALTKEERGKAMCLATPSHLRSVTQAHSNFTRHVLALQPLRRFVATR